MSAFVLSKIFPSMSFETSSQRFLFGNQPLPEPLGRMSIDNIYTPIIGIPSATHFNFRNNVTGNPLSGFRISHETQAGETIGTLRFQSFLNGSDSGTDIMSFNNDGSITFDSALDFDSFNLAKLGIGIAPTLDGSIAFSNTELTEKITLFQATTTGVGVTPEYNRSGLGYTSAVGSMYFTPVSTYHTFFAGTSFPLVSIGYSSAENKSILNMSSGKIVSLADPVDNQDAATKAFVLATAGSISTSIELIGAVTGSGDTSAPINTTLTDISTSQITDFSSSVLSFSLDQFAAPSANIDLNSKKITNLATPTLSGDATNKTFVESTVSTSISALTATLSGVVSGTGNLSSPIATTLAQNIPVGYTQLNMTWNDGTGGNPYIFNHEINDSAPFFKEHIYQVTSKSPDVQRKWNAVYDLGDPNAWSPTYQLTFYHPIFSPSGTTPFQLSNIGGGTSPVWGIFFGGTMDMGGFEVKNALNPTTAQSLTTRSYVDAKPLNTFGNPTGSINFNSFKGINVLDPTNPQDIATKSFVETSVDTSIAGSTLALTGSVTGSGNINGSIATSFSSNQSVTGGDTQTFTFTPSFASANFNIFNSNSSATTQVKIGNSSQYVSLGYLAAASYAALNLNNINQLTFLFNGSPQALLTNNGTFFGKFPSGVLYFQNNATTTTVTANTFTKMLGTTTLASSNFFSSPASNRLRYDGTQTVSFQISATVSIQHNQVFGATIGLAIYKNGVPVTPSQTYDYKSGNGQISSMTTTAFVSLATSDYVEIYVRCSNGATLTPTYAILSATMC